VTPLSRQRDISVNISANWPRIRYPGRADHTAERAPNALGVPPSGSVRRSVGEGFSALAVEHLPHPARSGGHVDVAQSGAMVERIDDGIDHQYDVTFRYNHILNVAGGFNIAANPAVGLLSSRIVPGWR
jgi:hypothetical protein